MYIAYFDHLKNTLDHENLKNLKKKHDDIESAFISNNNQKTNFAICDHLLICATFIIDYYVSKKKFNYLVSAGRNQTSC